MVCVDLVVFGSMLVEKVVGRFEVVVVGGVMKVGVFGVGVS